MSTTRFRTDTRVEAVSNMCNTFVCQIRWDMECVFVDAVITFIFSTENPPRHC